MVFPADKGTVPGIGLSSAERRAAALMSSNRDKTEGDWQSVGDLRQVLETADAVCCLLFDQDYPADYHPDTDIKIGTGTGFLIAPRLLMTCRHVVPHQKAAQHARARFFYDGRRQPLELALNPDETKGGFFLTSSLGRKIDQNNDLDFTIVALKEPTYATRYLSIFQCCILKDHLKDNKLNVYVIQHPGGTKDPRTTEEAHQREAKGVIKACEQRVVRYQVKTAGGASGAPVLNEENRLVAIHEGRHPQGSPLLPYGVRMDKIVSYLGEEGKKKIEAYAEQYGTAKALLERALKDFYLSCNTLPIFRPLKQSGKCEMKVPIETIYTNLTLKQKIVFEEDHPPKRQLLSLTATAPSNSSKNIVQLKDLFQLEAIREKSQKRVVFWGGAGIGKSTLCRFIAYQWAKEGLWQDLYQWLFVIPFRHLNAQHYFGSQPYTLADVLAQEGHCDVKMIQELLKTKHFTEHTLIIFDGYEEKLDNHLSFVFEACQEVFPHILVTSKPQKIEFDADCEIEIIGYSKANRRAYISHFFNEIQARNEISAAEASTRKNKLIQHLEKPAMKGLCHNPIHLTLICTLFNDDPSILKASKPLAVSYLYEQMIVWLYKWYLMSPPINQNQEKMDHIHMYSNQAIASHPKIKPLSTALHQLAWQAIKAENHHDLSLDKALSIFRDNNLNLEHLIESGLLQIEKHPHSTSVVFMHSIFRDYLAACYLASDYLAGQHEHMQTRITKRKFNSRYFNILWMLAGRLSMHAKESRRPEALQDFFNHLFSTFLDRAHSYQITLLVRCLEECACPEDIHQYPVIINEALHYLQTGLNPNLTVTLFRNHCLFTHHARVLKVIEKNLKSRSKQQITLAWIQSMNLMKASQFFSTAIFQVLKDLLKDSDSSDPNNQVFAIQTLVKLAMTGHVIPEPILFSLVELLSVSDNSLMGFIVARYIVDIKEAVVQALREINQTGQKIPESVIHHLLTILQNPRLSYLNRGYVVMALGNSVQKEHSHSVLEEVVDFLIKVSENPVTSEMTQEHEINEVRSLRNFLAEARSARGNNETSSSNAVNQERRTSRLNSINEEIHVNTMIALSKVSWLNHPLSEAAVASLIAFINNPDSNETVKMIAAQILRHQPRAFSAHAFSSLVDVLENLKETHDMTMRIVVEALINVARVRRIPDTLFTKIFEQIHSIERINAKINHLVRSGLKHPSQSSYIPPDIIVTALIEVLKESKGSKNRNLINSFLFGLSHILRNDIYNSFNFIFEVFTNLTEEREEKNNSQQYVIEFFIDIVKKISHLSGIPFNSVLDSFKDRIDEFAQARKRNMEDYKVVKDCERLILLKKRELDDEIEETQKIAILDEIVDLQMIADFKLKGIGKDFEENCDIFEFLSASWRLILSSGLFYDYLDLVEIWFRTEKLMSRLATIDLAAEMTHPTQIRPNKLAKIFIKILYQSHDEENPVITLLEFIQAIQKPSEEIMTFFQQLLIDLKVDPLIKKIAVDALIQYVQNEQISVEKTVDILIKILGKLEFKPSSDFFKKLPPSLFSNNWIFSLGALGFGLYLDSYTLSAEPLLTCIHQRPIALALVQVVEASQAEKFSQLLTSKLRVNQSTVFVLSEMQKKNYKISLQSIQKLISYIEDPRINNYNLIHRVLYILEHIDIRQYDINDISTHETLTQLCHITGRACFYEDGLFCIFDGQSKLSSTSPYRSSSGCQVL